MYKIETERDDLFDVNMIIAMKVTVAGTEQLAFDDFQKSFYDAVSAYEILNSRLSLKHDGSCFYEPCAELGGASQTISEASLSFEELLQQQEKIRFKLEGGEFLRCFVYEPCNGRRDFVFLMHHLGGDGKSLCYFIETFLNCLCRNGKKPECQPIKLLTKETLPEKSGLPFLAKLLANHYNKMWLKECGTSQIFSFEHMQQAYDNFWKNHRTVVHIYPLDEAELKAELAECKKAGIGYTSYAVAKLLKAENGTKSVGLAVDARPDGNRTMSNQATGISVDYAYNKKKTLVENAACIDRLMKAKLAKPELKYFILQFMAAFEPALVDAVNLEFAGAFHSKTSEKLARLLGYGTNTKDYSITNLTKLDIPVEYSGGRASLKIEDFVFVPPVVSYGKNIIGMVTANGRLNIAVHTYAEN